MEKEYILFAVARNATREFREGVRGRVANKFHGDPETTEIVGVDPKFRLYRMEAVS